MARHSKEKPRENLGFDSSGLATPELSSFVFLVSWLFFALKRGAFVEVRRSRCQPPEKHAKSK